MPRYEFSEGTSNKFWEINLKGTSFTTTYGKIGTDGQTTLKQFKSEAEAKKEYDKIVAEKTKKGYQLVGGGAGKAKAEKPAPAAKAEAKPAPAPKAEAKPAATPAAKPASGGGPSVAGARYFEFVEGTSSKFWEIRMEDTSVITRYGKIGTDGQSTTKDFDSKSEAFKEFDKLVNEKTKKGYQEKGGDASVSGDARNPELEAAILKNPTDKEAYQVYGDWLQEQGDPRGELIALMCSGKDKQAKQLLEKNADYFLGGLQEHQKTYDGDLGNNARENSDGWVKDNQQTFLWKYGFISRLRLAHDSYADEEFEGRLKDVLDLVLRHPSGRFITELSFNSNGDPNEDDLQDLIDLIAKKGMPTVRKVTIGDNVDQISWYNVGKLGKIWKALPQLEELYIEAGSFDIGPFDVPNLKKAIFKTGGLDKASAKAIATGNMPKIEHLEIYYGDENYGGNCTVKDVQPILDRTDLKNLTYLGLKNSEFTNELCKVIGKAKILKQLKVLDLSLGCMDDTGAAALVEFRDAFKHLDAIDVSENYLTDAGVKALKGLAKKIISTEQREDYEGNPEYRHPSVSE